jgi:shikimate kinase
MNYNNNILSLDKPIVLVGMMGAGKSTVGTRLAKKMRVPFYDTDNLVQEMAGCSIDDIFKYAGEEFFRTKERQVIEELLNLSNCVISTGGSAFIDADNRRRIKEKSISVWLRADYDTILERVSRRNTRPTLKSGNKADLVEQMIKDCYLIYEEADLCVNSGDGPHMIIVDDIIQKVSNLYNK